MERPKNAEVRREMNEEEKGAMDVFKDNDKKIVFPYFLRN